MDRTLLLVDDEENIIRSLIRLLRKDDYNILTAKSGADGLAILAENDVGVIISDQRMPEMSGVEFLSKVKEKYPDNVRIVLSGYTDLKSVTDAINEGAIYKFLTKPWDDDQLRANVKDAFSHYELARENERLTSALQHANEELSRLNSELKRDVRQKDRFVDINLRTLQIAQEVLENLPIGVMGIGEDQMIAIANLTAHELLWPNGGAMVGSFAQQALPKNVADSFQTYLSGNETVQHQIETDNGKKLTVLFKPLGHDSISHGSICVLMPETGDEA